MRDEFTRLRTEQIALRQDVEIERQARIAAEERATRVGALKQMEELKQLAVQAVAEAEEAREEAEEATELALAFETEADGYKRDVEHLEKTARNLKSKNKKLEFDLQRMQKGGALKGIRGGAKYLDEDEVAKIYGEQIKELKAEVEMLNGKSAQLSKTNMSSKQKLETLQKKYDDMIQVGFLLIFTVLRLFCDCFATDLRLIWAYYLAERRRRWRGRRWVPGLGK